MCEERVRCLLILNISQVNDASNSNTPGTKTSNSTLQTFLKDTQERIARSSGKKDWSHALFFSFSLCCCFYLPSLALRGALLLLFLFLLLIFFHRWSELKWRVPLGALSSFLPFGAPRPKMLKKMGCCEEEEEEEGSFRSHLLILRSACTLWLS